MPKIISPGWMPKTILRMVTCPACVSDLVDFVKLPLFIVWRASVLWWLSFILQTLMQDVTESCQDSQNDYHLPICDWISTLCHIFVSDYSVLPNLSVSDYSVLQNDI